MALKVLIADSDIEWLKSVKETFLEAGYEVTLANTGKLAQSKLHEVKYFFIIISTRLTDHSGLQVLKFIKLNSPSQKVITISDSNIESEDYYDVGTLKKLGSRKIVYRPFSFNDLLEQLDGEESLTDLYSNTKKQVKSKAKAEELNDNLFRSISINDFFGGQKILFDIFIKLGTNKYIKLLYAGDAFDKKRVIKYRDEKNVKELYFKKTDTSKFLKVNNFFASKVIASDKVKGSKKLNLLQDVTEIFLDQAFVEGMKPKVIDQGMEIANNIFRFVEKEKELHNILKSYYDFDPNAYTHSFMVSIFTTAIIKEFEWESKVTIENAAFASLFHDIGKMKLSKEIRDKKVIELNEDELKIYKTHPKLGLSMIEDNPNINYSVKQMIIQHHECFDGTGFPKKLFGPKILTLSNILSLADKFVHIIQEQNVKPVKALQIFLSDRDGMKKFNIKIIENLISAFTPSDKKKKVI